VNYEEWVREEEIIEREDPETPNESGDTPQVDDTEDPEEP
jgi:hypothetical protein